MTILTTCNGTRIPNNSARAVVPEFVAEIVSPTDRSSDVEEKVNAWIQSGVRVVLVVDPQTKSVRRYVAGQDVQIQQSGTLELEAAIPRFKLDVAELFA